MTINISGVVIRIILDPTDSRNPIDLLGVNKERLKFTLPVALSIVIPSFSSENLALVWV